jgi:MFS family permease
VLGGDALAAVGGGLTLPYLVVYLHEVRGVEIGLAGLAVSALAAAGVIGNPLGGWLSDRIGARRALIAGLVVAAAGAAGLAGVRGTGQAFAAAGTVGLGAAMVLPALDALLGGTVDPAARSAVFAIRFAILNAGLGAGALLAALLVDVANPATFELVYLLEAAGSLAFAAILAALGDPEPRTSGRARTEAGGGYRAVARDPAFRRVWVLMALLVAAGYGPMLAALPAYAVDKGAGAGALGVVFAANTFTVVAGQLVVLKLLEGRRRTRAIALLCGCWGLAWMLVPVAGGLPAGLAGTAGLAAAVVVFALGETLLAPTLPAIVNDLAPEHLRGRYNGAFSLASTTGFLVGPALAGAALAAGAGEAFFIGLTGVLMLAALAARGLERVLPPTFNHIGGTPRAERERPAFAHAGLAAEAPA